MKNLVKTKSWDFTPIERKDVKQSQYRHHGYYVEVHNGKAYLMKKGECTIQCISTSYTISWFKFKSYTVAKWSKYTVFFDAEMKEIKDPREQVNNACNWVRIGEKICCVDEYGEVFDTYSREYCRLRGLNFNDYLEMVGENVLANA